MTGAVPPVRATWDGSRGATWPLSVAPMMDWTDQHYRRLARGITRRTLLYTEMVTTAALLHGDPDRLLAHRPEDGPVALQLGGDDPEGVAFGARLGAAAGFAEVNLNVGCPSDRVQRGRFGACLMADPQRVAELVAAAREAVPLPVTVKHRIGIDDADRYQDLLHFVDVVAAAGADRFTVHARKAWLKGLSPKQNREIPPLRYSEVRRLKAERPHLRIELNGGVRDLSAVQEHLGWADGVMIGRAAYQAPLLLAQADQRFFAVGAEVPTLRTVVERYRPWVESALHANARFATVARPLLGLLRGVPGARVWRRILTEQGHRRGAGTEVLDAALAALPDAVLEARPAADGRLQPVTKAQAVRREVAA